jgi:hypothetical protein
MVGMHNVGTIFKMLEMRKSYVKWILVLCGLTLVFDLWACTPNGVTEETYTGEDTIVAVKDDPADYSGEYVFNTSSGSGVLKVFGPTPSEELLFSLVMTTDSGCAIERTGRARLYEKTKAVFYQVNTNCRLELNFSGPEVQVIQNNCPERDTLPCSFDGTYVLSME